jgi:hypothetical protein
MKAYPASLNLNREPRSTGKPGPDWFRKLEPAPDSIGEDWSPTCPRESGDVRGDWKSSVFKSEEWPGGLLQKFKTAPGSPKRGTVSAMGVAFLLGWFLDFFLDNPTFLPSNLISFSFFHPLKNSSSLFIAGLSLERMTRVPPYLVVVFLSMTQDSGLSQRCRDAPLQKEWRKFQTLPTLCIFNGKIFFAISSIFFCRKFPAIMIYGLYSKKLKYLLISAR